MKFRNIIIALFVALPIACGCGEPEQFFTLPSPGREANGTLDNPFAPPEDPDGPDNPDEPGAPSEEDIARLERIGQTPVVEIYFTEYTDKSLFPTLEEIKYFTHVNVGHARFRNKATGDGGLVIADEEIVSKMAAFKKDYPELRVKIMIGGWGKNADGFSMMARDKDKRALFVSECVRICNDFNLDGVDLDWEYPTYAAKDGDYVNGASADDYANFITLLRELREAMPDKIISYAASESGKYTDNAKALAYADYINVMTYDYGNPPYHNSPLYPSKVTRNRSCAESIDDIFHTAQGIPYDRMNFGVPFYGHGDGYSGGANTVYPGTVNYNLLSEILFSGTCKGESVSGKNYRYWDNDAKVPYLGDALGVMYASYEDIESLNCKVEFLLQRKMLGAMAWEYREDDAQGTLRHALRHAMDGNPDEPGRLERPDKYKGEIPKLGTATTYKLDNVQELSGLCLSSDGTFLWGVGDEGKVYKINFDGTASLHWEHSADMEGVTMNPETKDLYVSIEGEQKVYQIYAPEYKTYKTIFYVQEAVDGNYGNSGLEGITWYKDNTLYIGSQKKANLWCYGVDGTRKSLVSLRNVASGIKEVGDLCYDPETDFLWVIDSDVFKIFLFSGDATVLLATYDISGLTKNNPECICVDHGNNCLWIADDDSKSILHKLPFEK